MVYSDTKVQFRSDYDAYPAKTTRQFIQQNGDKDPLVKILRNQIAAEKSGKNFYELYTSRGDQPGMTVREIQSHLEEMYGVEVSPTLISKVTDAVMDEAKAWQSRPLYVLQPIVYLDCIHLKTRDGGAGRVKAVYMVLGINMQGEKEILGLWVAQTEGSKFWLQVATELKNRGVQDIFIACVDGLKGFPETIEAVYPQSAVQLCLVHMVRHSLALANIAMVNWGNSNVPS